jgi:hypothetical protein
MGIKSRERFIEKEGGWMWSHRACESHTLLLSPGETAGIAPLKTHEAAASDLFRDTPGALFSAEIPQSKADIFRDSQMWEERVMLKHQSDVARSARQRNAFSGIEQCLTVENDASAHSGLEPRNRSQRHRLPGAGRAQDSHRLCRGGEGNTICKAWKVFFELDF